MRLTENAVIWLAYADSSRKHVPAHAYADSRSTEKAEIWLACADSRRKHMPTHALHCLGFVLDICLFASTIFCFKKKYQLSKR